jgi:anthranilate phosphoribosyltransferase
VARSRFDPAEALGWTVERAGLEGGERDENARKIDGVLRGEIRDAARAAAVLNAGAAVYVGGTAESLTEGIRRAEAALDDGTAYAKLQALREATA